MVKSIIEKRMNGCTHICSRDGKTHKTKQTIKFRRVRKSIKSNRHSIKAIYNRPNLAKAKKGSKPVHQPNLENK
jgi:hypothetical protein